MINIFKNDVLETNTVSNKIKPNYFIKERIINNNNLKKQILINGKICECLLKYLNENKILLNFKPLKKNLFNQLIKKGNCECEKFIISKNNNNLKNFCKCKNINYNYLSFNEDFKKTPEIKVNEKISNKSPKISEKNIIYLYFSRGKTINDKFYYCPCMSGKDSVEQEINKQYNHKQQIINNEIDELLNKDSLKGIMNNHLNKTINNNNMDEIKSNKNSDNLSISSPILNNSINNNQSITTEGSCSTVCECESNDNKTNSNILSENLASSSHDTVDNKNSYSVINNNKKDYTVDKSEKCKEEDKGINETLEEYEYDETKLVNNKEIKNIKTDEEVPLLKKSEEKNNNLPYGSDPNIGLSKQSNLSATEEVDINELELNKHNKKEPIFPTTMEIIPVKRNTFLHKLRSENLILAEGWIWKKRYFFSCLYHKRYFILTKDAEIIYFRDPHCVTGIQEDIENEENYENNTLIYPNTIPFNYNRLFDPSISPEPGEVQKRTKDIPVINRNLCLENPKFLSLTDSMEIYRATCLSENHPYKLVLKHSYYNDQLLFDTQSERDLWAARVTYIKKRYSETRKRYIQTSVPTNNN